MSNIEWTDATWNPVTGCSKVSPGCAHCYAETLSHRFGMTKKPWTPENAAENVVLHPERLDAPLHWRKPKRVFVNSMSDLFHEQVPDRFIGEVFDVMARAPRHVFQILTKRPERMLAWVGARPTLPGGYGVFNEPWPLPNVWLGVSVENQHFADERIPLLLQTPAAVRFLSCEPLLGPVDLRNWRYPLCAEPHHFAPFGCEEDDHASTRIDWIIIGGESGPRHRPMDLAWARSLVAQCRAANVPAFVKQLGGARPGTKLEDLPADLRVREWPV